MTVVVGNNTSVSTDGMFSEEQATTGLSITYIDTNGDTITLVEDTDYTVDESGLLTRIFPVFNSSWPTTRGGRATVTVTWDAGYDDADSVPDELKAAIKLIVAGLYENREHVNAVPSTYKTNPTVSALLGHYRIIEAL